MCIGTEIMSEYSYILCVQTMVVTYGDGAKLQFVRYWAVFSVAV